ncbi:hypothetical protein CLOSCI_01596 [[Clostridium] scindens ATCC 35704]|nr:hypothetical protein CLOSCI_01596 [[Clostridium] scindens ATCC 35704]
MMSPFSISIVIIGFSIIYFLSFFKYINRIIYCNGYFSIRKVS